MIAGNSMPATPLSERHPMEVRIKDITTIEGHRSYWLNGIGLVAGLDGSGGNDELTRQVARNFLVNSGIQPRDLQTKNLCAVSVQVEVEPFTAPGEPLTAMVSMLGAGKDLYGGTLLRTAMQAIDGRTYAIAQGPLQIGGFSAEGAAGSVKKNHPTVGISSATLFEPIECQNPFPGNEIRLLLRNKDLTTSYRIATQINEFFPRTARAESQGSVLIEIPRPFWSNKAAFAVMIKNLYVRPDVAARVVINEKTGTIVIGQNVKISGLVFAKDNLVITNNEAPIASQPAPFSDGDTVVLPRTQLEAVEQGGRYNMLNSNTTVGELAAALNQLGVTPQDLISVFDAIHQSGSLHAELITR
jgi:flagellar P-ring protein precursor FlgI